MEYYEINKGKIGFKLIIISYFADKTNIVEV